jgi:hypothetical protein
MASGPEDLGDPFLAALTFRPVRGPVMGEPVNETSVVRAAREGDRMAFAQLYDVFMIALRRLPMLREAESFGAWLTVIARNRANDYHRRSVPEDQLADEAGHNTLVSPNGGENSEAKDSTLTKHTPSRPGRALGSRKAAD